MYSLLILSVASFILSIALTPLMRNWSLRWGLVDRPDQFRKLHRAPTPRTGGVPILLSYCGAYLFLLVLPLRSGAMIESHLVHIWKLLPPVVLVFAVGLLD